MKSPRDVALELARRFSHEFTEGITLDVNPASTPFDRVVNTLTPLLEEIDAANDFIATYAKEINELKLSPWSEAASNSLYRKFEAYDAIRKRNEGEK